MKLRARARNTEEQVIGKSADGQFGVDTSPRGQQVRDDRPTYRRQLVGRQPVQQPRCVPASQFQLAERRQVDNSGLLHHRPAFAHHRVKPAHVDQFLNTKVSQGSVATRLRYDGIFNNHFITHLPPSPQVKEFRKSVNICQSYGQELRIKCPVFFESLIAAPSSTVSWTL